MDDAREALKGLAARASRARPLDPDDDVYSYENAIRAALDERDALVERHGKGRRVVVGETALLAPGMEYIYDSPVPTHRLIKEPTDD